MEEEFRCSARFLPMRTRSRSGDRSQQRPAAPQQWWKEKRCAADRNVASRPFATATLSGRPLSANRGIRILTGRLLPALNRNLNFNLHALPFVVRPLHSAQNWLLKGCDEPLSYCSSVVLHPADGVQRRIQKGEWEMGMGELG